MFLYTISRFSAQADGTGESGNRIIWKEYFIFRRLLACSLLLWYTEEKGKRKARMK